MLIVVQIRYELIWGTVILREMAQTQFIIFLFHSLSFSLSLTQTFYISLFHSISLFQIYKF